MRVLPDGTWSADGRPVEHANTLRYLKAHLVVDAKGPAVVDGPQRVPVRLEGPPLQVLALVIDPGRGEVRALLDDGTEERVRDGAISMSPLSGRFVLAARGGTLEALLLRSAHETLLAAAQEFAGSFAIVAGSHRVGIRT
jgi:hypothetical protein